MNISHPLQSLFRFVLVCALHTSIFGPTNLVNAQTPIQVLVPDPAFGTAGVLHIPNNYVLSYVQVVDDHAVIRQSIIGPSQRFAPTIDSRLCRVEANGQLGNCTEWISLINSYSWGIRGYQSSGRVLNPDPVSGMVRRLNSDLTVDNTFTATNWCSNFDLHFMYCTVRKNDQLFELSRTFDTFFENNTITATQYLSNGVIESMTSTLIHRVEFPNYLDEQTPISASLPISSLITFLYTHQTPVDVPPCRWEVYTPDLQPLGSVDLIQTQQPCITTAPAAHPDGGLVWMELARDRNDIEIGRQIYKTRPDFSIDTSFGVSGVVTAALTSEGPFTNTQLLVQPDGHLLAIFEKQEGWLLKQFDRDGSHAQWLGLFASDIAPILTTDGKIITRRGNVLSRYHKITVANLDQRVMLPVVVR